MKRKLLLMSGLAALSLSGALLGCGGGDSTGDPTPTPSPSPNPGGETRRIIFAAGGIFIMNPDGTNRVQLTTRETYSDNDPALSPDERQVAFVRPTGRGYRLMLVNVDGTNLRQLVGETRYLRVPHWHPDGTRIAYGASISSTSSSEGIFTINADGTGAKRLAEAGDAVHPDWSPDGKKLAFVSDRAGAGGDIYTINADGTGLFRVTNTPDYAEWVPRWSPDGKKLVSYCDFTNSTDTHLYSLNADGTGRVAMGLEKSQRPSFSPSGKKILFAVATFLDIFTMNADGTDVQNLTNTIEKEADPSW